MSELLLLFLIIPAFAVFFGLLWTTIVYLISRLGGWARLAEQFPAPGPVTGKVFNWCSARFGIFANYRNSLTITVSADGLHMQPLIFFRIGHEPVFIPWDAVTDIWLRDMMLFKSIQVGVRDPETGLPKVFTLFGKSLFEAMDKALQVYRQRSGG